MGFFYKASAAAAAVGEYSNYAGLPAAADSTDGDTARTTNNNTTWRFSSTAGCWIPSDFYDSGLAIQQDRSGTPKDINFTTPQISDLSPLSDYDLRENGTGTIVDGTDEIIITGNGGGNNARIQFSRETHTGDSLFIADLDYAFTAGSPMTQFFDGFEFQNHTSKTLNKTVLLHPAGPGGNASNNFLILESPTAIGDASRPITGCSITAGHRVFLRFNSGELVTGSSDQFIELIAQDKDQRFTIRAPYNEIGQATGLSEHYIFINAVFGVLKIKRFQLLKYT